MTNVFRMGSFGLSLLALIMLTGCASVSVKEAKNGKESPQKLPKHIYVASFSIKGAEFNVDREGKELEEFKKESVATMQAALVERLPVLAPASNALSVLPEKGWLIRGQFVRVNQGSRALRAAVGFGAGATKMETRVQVYDLDLNPDKPFLSFSTTGGSNAEPGALSGLGPLTWITGVGILAGGAGNALHGLTEDAERTAREIRNRLVDYSIEHKYVSAEWAKTIRPEVSNPRGSGSK